MAPMGFEGSDRRVAPVLGELQVQETGDTVAVTVTEVQQWRDDEVRRVEAARLFGYQAVTGCIHQLAVDREARGFGPQSSW